MSISVKESSSTEEITINDHLTPIAIEALKVRTEFFDHLDSLPAPFNERAKEHYINRLVRSEGRHMLGEYSPFFLADILQIPYDKVTDVTIPWLVLYQHSLLIDDIIDAPNDFGAKDVLLSQILFSNFIFIGQKWFLRFPDLLQIFCDYQSEGVFAAFEELKKSPDSFSDNTDFDSCGIYNSLLMGRKASLVKFCASMLNLENEGVILQTHQEIGIDSLCAGIQLLDDLTDSIEDYQSKRYNYPLHKAIGVLLEKYNLTFNQTRLNHLSDNEIISILILSGVINNISDEASSYLRKGIVELHIPPDSITGKYLCSLIEKNSASIILLKTIIEENFDFMNKLVFSLGKNKSSLEEFISIPENAKIWSKMKYCLRIIASAAN